MRERIKRWDSRVRREFGNIQKHTGELQHPELVSNPKAYTARPCRRGGQHGEAPEEEVGTLAHDPPQRQSLYSVFDLSIFLIKASLYCHTSRFNM